MVTLAKPPTRKQLEVIAGGDQELIRALEKLFQQALNLTPTEFSQLQEQVAQDTSAILANTNAISDLSDGTVSITPDLVAGWEVGGVPITASGVEINRLVGVSSPIQTQINARALLAGQSTILTESGASKDQIIPAGVTQINIGFSFVSLSGTDDILVQIGTGGTPQTSSYASACSVITSTVTTTGNTDGFRIELGGAAKRVHGIFTLSVVDSSANAWAASWSLRADGAEVAAGGGSVFLSGSLDIVRVLPSGADTFDNGRIGFVWS